MRHCTIPEILHVRDWFEKNYGGCCRKHDKDYTEGYYSRRMADVILLECMLKVVKRKPWHKRVAHYPFCYATYFFVRLFGWMHYNSYNYD